MRSLLFILVYFVAFTALSSGLIMVLKPDGSSLKLNLQMLEGTPFHNFLVPGLLLIFIIGGTQILAILLSILRHPQTYKVTRTAGLILIAWIAFQLMMVHSYFWLNGVYLLIGVLISLLSYQFIGKAAF